MSDDKATSESSLLASVYVDGATSSDERALVETSTETLAEAAELSDVRSVLGATAPLAPLSARESHLAAALDVWERMTDLERAGDATPSDGLAAAAAAAVSTPATGSRRVRDERRRHVAGLNRQQWLLGAAATLMVVVGAGIVATGVVTENDDDDTDDIALEQPAEATELSELEAAEAAEVNGENVGVDVAPVESDLSDEAAEPGRSLDEDSADPSIADEELPGEEQPPPPPEKATLEILDAEELAIYASLAIPSLEATNQANADLEFEAPFGSCEAQLGIDEEVEPVIYEGVEVVVGVDLDNSLVIAYTPGDCDVVETTALRSDIDRGEVVDS